MQCRLSALNTNLRLQISSRFSKFKARWRMSSLAISMNIDMYFKGYAFQFAQA